jgi:hypothetical protein
MVLIKPQRGGISIPEGGNIAIEVILEFEDSNDILHVIHRRIGNSNNIFIIFHKCYYV